MNTFINKSKKTKVLSCVAAAAVAFVMTAAPVFAADSSGRNVKDETVYVVTESDGSTSDIIVSDHLKNKASTDTISDTTSLTDIENTKGSSPRVITTRSHGLQKARTFTTRGKRTRKLRSP